MCKTKSRFAQELPLFPNFLVLHQLTTVTNRQAAIIKYLFQGHINEALTRVEPNNHEVLVKVKTTLLTNCATFPLLFMSNEYWRD